MGETLGGVFNAVIRTRMRAQEERIERLEAQPQVPKPESRLARLRASAAEKLRQGAPVSRPEAAAYLGVSTRKLQRMEDAGTLRRCPGLGAVVKYAARDILRLASAQ
jgi:hypothetical protein